MLHLGIWQDGDGIGVGRPPAGNGLAVRFDIKSGSTGRGVGGEGRVEEAGRQRHAVQVGAAEQLLRLPVDQFCAAVDATEVLAVPCTERSRHEYFSQDI